MAIRTQIIDVQRKPAKCPVCGGEIWDIIYGTGDLTEIEFRMNSSPIKLDLNRPKQTLN